MALAATVVFTVACLVGVAYRLKALREVRVDRSYVERKYGDGAKEAAMIIANGAVESECVGLAVKTLLTSIGVFGLFVQPPPGGEWFVVFRIYAFGALTAIVVAMDVRSYRGLRERRRVIELEREEDLLEKGAAE